MVASGPESEVATPTERKSMHGGGVLTDFISTGGCFWCMEEAFERYGPGVIEAVSGFSAGENENPVCACVFLVIMYAFVCVCVV